MRIAFMVRIIDYARTMSEPRRIIVGMTGATGTLIAVRLLQMLQDADVETHLVMSKWAVRTLLHETSYGPEDVERLATRVYAAGDQGAAISSGSFVTDGMIVVPCSMRTLAAIAHGFGDHLIHRAADVILKERRKLVLAVREAPFNDIHLENMLKLSRMGVVICPPFPAFYTRPETIDDIVTYAAARLLDQVGIHLDMKKRWTGEMAELGLDYASLAARNPRLIMLSTSNLGQTGPRATHPGFGTQLSSLSGFTELIGTPDGPPHPLYGPYIDYVAVAYGGAAVLA